MDLTHRFSVPASPAETWAAFNDIESVAACFPGAQVTSVEGDTFQGSCKVKLGPIALVYNGSGTFTEKDEAAGRMVISAKGKDKRGNGTAGADVTVSLAEGATGTDVEVVTDLAITGKPAQFGRGVIQDVSDKLLAQFVSCLEDKVGGPGAGNGAATGGEEADQDAGPASEPSGAAAREAPAGDQDAGAASVPAGAAAPRGAGTDDDALDLGSALLPVLLKSYGKQVAAALGVLVMLAWLRRRRHR